MSLKSRLLTVAVSATVFAVNVVAAFPALAAPAAAATSDPVRFDSSQAQHFWLRWRVRPTIGSAIPRAAFTNSDQTGQFPGG